ncbi:hypothetical protein [Bradyrhizobium symbiodeficiens]|uniref:Uncharacterized protein n=1 Tax=Bradyrhizobium symbiodeficiens TaxID=1404367 RepID=A0AAJ6N4B0_9BRAD|nr:hypothetical protein [Bradyrhizobium symbiodeficiens]
MANDMACTSGMTGQDVDAFLPSRKLLREVADNLFSDRPTAA